VWKNFIVPLIGLLGALLSIARFKATMSEIWAVGIFIGVVLLIFGYKLTCFFFNKVIPWVRRRRQILRIARWIARLGLTESGIERMSNWIKVHAPERPASKDEVDRIVCETRLLQGQKEVDRLAVLNHLRQEIFNEKLIWFRWHEAADSAYDFDFDSFRFLNLNSPSSGLELLKHQIKNDILTRFGTGKFQTVVFILRSETNYQIGAFFEELKTVLQFEDFIGFSPNEKQREKYSVWEADLLKVCSGKSVLLVEPLLTDRGLDEAYENITRWRGNINGVVVMFEVKGFHPTSLAHYTELKSKSGQPELCGQIVLDLHKSQ